MQVLHHQIIYEQLSHFLRQIFFIGLLWGKQTINGEEDEAEELRKEKV